MRTISIKGVQYAYDSVKNPNNAGIQALLAGCHRLADVRPLCLCKTDGIPLQVRKLDGIFHLARMPDQGLSHDKACNFYGETDHSGSHASGEKLSVSFPLHLNKSETDGDISLIGLLNLLWTRSNLHRWSMTNKPRSWSSVVKKLYESAHGLNLNGISISQLLWILPSIDGDLEKQLRDGCLNFVRSCNTNGQYAIIIAPIDSSEAIGESKRLRFRKMENPQTFVESTKFPINTSSLRLSAQCLFPVAIFLARVPDDKFYLKAHDIAMLWMTPSYLPCSTKARTKSLMDIMDNSEYLHVNLDIESGLLLDDYAVVRKDNKFTAMKSPETPNYPWLKK